MKGFAGCSSSCTIMHKNLQQQQQQQQRQRMMLTATRVDVAVAVATTIAAAAAILEYTNQDLQISLSISRRLTFLIHSIFQYFTTTRKCQLKIKTLGELTAGVEVTSTTVTVSTRSMLGFSSLHAQSIM
jgi:hypothetical protein